MFEENQDLISFKTALIFSTTYRERDAPTTQLSISHH
ncbi:hypothetical protein NIES267_64510 [Calothrix parasitica NIES-267]|uniref:Uncharacterized protein n=1 Tax=Calothrix parasitica NIES-267 TaxID=1973488 RepID=A0A1Z4M0E5_9CYAN|nr:hypothetical protein NIES267_64510 [Calothrix parasitica NIES-267]